MSLQAKYDPLLFKSPKGVIAKNTKVKFRIQVETDENLKHVYFMLKKDGEPDYRYLEMTKVQDGYEFEQNFSDFGHFWYNFQLVFCDFCVYLNKTFDTRSSLSPEKGEDYLQLVTEKNYDCKNSLQGGIIYQIYVDRFSKEGEVEVRKPLVLRDDWGGRIQKNTTNPIRINQEVFGGNIKGIISKLDYLETLGVTAIYLNPISLANSNHKYDTADYMKIDDMFGTESDFEQLVKLAKEKDIKIVIDGVYNHTGSDSIYFNKNGTFNTLGAFKSKQSRFYNWYDFEKYPNKYRCWWGIDTLPSINQNCQDFQNYIAGENGVLEKYLKLGISGVRLDVVDEISDDFVQKIEKKVHEYGKDNVVMGEVWEDASTKESYSKRRQYFSKNELNSVMNYPIKETALEYIFSKDSFTLESTLRMLENNYPKVVRDNLMNFLTTHDTKRVFSEILKSCDEDKAKATRLYKIASTLIFTLPGVPSIFYGDEYGMLNNDGSSRGCFDWIGYKNEIYDWFLKLAKIRQLKVLKDGELNILYSRHGKFVFERFNENERIIVAVNLSSSPFVLDVLGEFKSFVSGSVFMGTKLNQNDFEILIETNKNQNKNKSLWLS